MIASKSADKSLLVSRSEARKAFREALRLYIGRGKRYSVKQVWNATGVADRMIESFMADPESADYRRPDLEEVLSLASFLGPEFTSEWLHLADQGAFHLPEAEDLPPGELAADNAEDNADLTRAAIDGKFDRSEKPKLHTVGTRMMVRGAQLRAIGAAA